MTDRRCLLPRRVASGLAGLAATVLVAGCSGGDGGTPVPSASATLAAPRPAPSLPTCATPPPSRVRWPAPVPADLPVPPGSTVKDTRKTADGLTIVQFTTSAPLRDGLLFVVNELPAKGFVLGRGDAEAAEADAPFVKGAVRGLFRMIVRDACTTDWLLAVTDRTLGGPGAPLLPARPGAGSPSPLPFG